MNYAPALEIANHVILNLRDRCEQIEIAGSLRRRLPVVGDIEVCAIPQIHDTTDLFGASSYKCSELDDYPFLLWGKVLKNGSRYKQIALNEGIKLDLFIVLPPAQWGVIFAIRTGPADYSRWIVTQRRKGGCLPSDCQVRDGGVYRHGELIPMPTEVSFLVFLGLGWIDPSERKVGFKKEG